MSMAYISCHYCHDKVSDEQRKRFKEREKQSQLAAERGFSHVGEDAKKLAKLNKEQKIQLKEKSKEANKTT